ncbi:hypothetical protein INS49_014076 [Diaporthe citri]|uniref:uncharacterized protein n=1 Tax=Diaporthe citri TaxID=83186 RepID=UPI001C7F4F9A|nr:uncharacterized protein INS49_014076 [Diaporthe citri]KAG6358192.1 hypothetical protein INS49_014076 [Diaporthe citri]
MKTKFGVTSVSNGGEALSLFGNPRIIRIRLASKVNRATWKGGAFTVGSARCFSYNGIARKTMRKRADGTTVVSDSSSGGVEDKIVYFLIAVVRLRNPGEDGDYARLYDIESRNILPTGNQEHIDTFNNKLTINCIRHGLEIGDQISDHDPMGERQMEGLWQKRNVLRNLPEQHTTNAIRTTPAVPVERVPEQTIPHGRKSNTPPISLQPPAARPADGFPIPPHPPNGPRVDRGVKRGMNPDEKIGHDDSKRPKLTDGDALPRGGAMAPPSHQGRCSGCLRQ